MRCPACSFENPEGVRFCGSCGAALAEQCAACGAENPAGFRFCGMCGATLVPVEAAETSVAIPGERRRVTVLFADLVGFSTLAEHLDPEELRTLMTDTFAELTEEVEARGGWVEKFIGDAVVAVFGAPVTHEDDPERAVEAALAMVEVVRRRSAGTPSPLQLRIGINSGLVVSGAVGDGTQTGVMGDAVNVAARLQQTADPGEILLAASTWRRVRDAFGADFVGSLEVNGKAQPVEAYRALGRRQAEQRRRAPFVGRHEERALLELLWSSARKGNTHVASVVGEPGVGKSRLLAEFRPESGEVDLRVACGGERAFGPFLDLIERLIGSTPSNLAELKTKAAALGVEEEDAVLVGAFLGLGGAPPSVLNVADEQRKRQVFAGFWQFLVAACRERPALVALDDIHWADESSRDLLDFLLEQLGGVPLMLVLCYRPGFEQIERSELRASHTAIRLEPLSADESVELARGFLGVAELPSDLERLVAARAEGNPFFIEELLQALLELGSLGVVDGRAVLAKVEVDVPDTVQGTILARIDRLGAQERSLLQSAAVLGRSFSAELLQEVVDEGDLSKVLAVLARAQLLVMARPGEWSFKHALIQEVVYETLLLRTRQELHRKVAEAIERRAGDDPTVLEVLAEHYARAEAPEAARRYAVAAGDLARERMGFVEARRHYETALRLWGEGDEDGRLELITKLGYAAHVAGDISAARTAFIEVEEGWRNRGDRRRAGAALATLGRLYWVSGDSDRAAKALDRAISDLGEHGPSAELVQAYTWASAFHMLSGNEHDGAALAQQGLSLADDLGLDSFRSNLLNTLGVCEFNSGKAQGLDRLRESLKIAHRARDAEALGRAYANLADILWSAGDLRGAVEIGREGREVLRGYGATAFEGFTGIYEAISLADLGLIEEAEALVDKILEERRGVFGAPGLVRAAMTKATILLRRGAYKEARGLLDDALPQARRVGGPEFLGLPLLTEAELESARGNAGAARQAIQDAVDVVFAMPSELYWVQLLPIAARLLPVAKAKELIERVRDYRTGPMAEALRAAAEGVVDADAQRSHAAADLYASMSMPYQEAECRIDAGELERAGKLVERFGFEEGPLGARLALTRQEPRPIHSSPPS